MLHLVSAYNGETLTRQNLWRAGNTVGSLNAEERAIVVGCMLGDGAMRSKIDALLEINHSIAQRDYVEWK